MIVCRVGSCRVRKRFGFIPYLTVGCAFEPWRIERRLRRVRTESTPLLPSSAYSLFSSANSAFKSPVPRADGGPQLPLRRGWRLPHTMTVIVHDHCHCGSGVTACVCRCTNGRPG